MTVDDVTEQTRAAFAHGWAVSDGPMTDTVRAACQVALDLVHEHGATDDTLEAVADLGRLSGTWALMAARREQLYREPLAAIVTAWRKLAKHVDLRAAVTRFRHNLGIDELADPEKQRRTAEAAAAAVLALHILVDPNSPDWQRFVDALADGMGIAQAEGVAGAIGVAAAQSGVTGIDFQAAFDDAYAAQPVSSNADTRAAAQAVAVGIIRGATTDLTRTLAASARDDLSFDDTLLLADDTLGWSGDTDDRSAARLLGDTALSRAFLGGMLAWFVAQGVRQVDWVTTASACPYCLDLESKNPWMVFEIPDPPAHPHCRCSVEAAGATFTFDFSRYL